MKHHLYLSEEITAESIRPLVEEIIRLNKEVEEELNYQHNNVITAMEGGYVSANSYIELQDNVKDSILLHINCVGGCVASTLSLMNTMKTSLIPIDTIVDGEACSGGFWIFTQGERRYVYRSSQLMLHNLGYGKWDRLEGHKKYMKYTEKLQETLNNTLLENTLMTDEYLKSLEGDYWWIVEHDKEELLDLGIIDFVIDDKEEIFKGDCEICEDCDGGCE